LHQTEPALLLAPFGTSGLTLCFWQVSLIKQEKVACLIDNDATLALEPSDSFALQTKPHGHGDVHALLHSSGLAARWQRSGLKWICFFQVNPLALCHSLLPLISFTRIASS
jgi:UDP-N-acetylglucosamine pyrophosphorylase